MVCHVLNGDALAASFPEELAGERLVMRECLLVGPIDSRIDEKFYQNRAGFLESNYPGGNDYQSHVQAQIDALLSLPQQTEINLWFENDLFCVVNFLFLSRLLSTQKRSSIFYVSASVRNGQSVDPNYSYGFGGMDKNALKTAFESRTFVSSAELNDLSELWLAYCLDDVDRMIMIAGNLSMNFPFLEAAMQARKSLLDRNHTKNPYFVFNAWLEVDPNLDFNSAFRRFSLEFPIYGFGDLQVQSIFEEVQDDRALL